MKRHLSRRHFFGLAAASTVCSLGSGEQTRGSNKNSVSPSEWTIGCFDRPWSSWTYDDALSNIKSAGYLVTGYLGTHAGEQFISPGASNDYLHQLKQRIDSRGLSMNVAWLRTDHNLTVNETIRSARTQVDNAALLGCKFLMTTGVNKPDRHQHYYRVMADVTAYADERNIQVVLKPHGGCSASAEELLRCIDRVDHQNFRIWYDAGNIIHYTGKDPVVDVARVAPLVTGFCAKDCGSRGGDVMIQFGTGKVDFRGVFSKLKDAGFSGPIMVECCAGTTQQEVTVNARRNRVFLKELLAGL